MKVDKDELNRIILNNEKYLKDGNIKSVYDKYFRDDLGRIFIQALIDIGYTPEQILDKAHAEYIDLVNTGLFDSIKFPEDHKTISLKGIADILSNAFRYSNVQKIIDTSKIERIQYAAFYSSDLEEIALPAIKTIESDVFRSCRHLTKITLGENLKSVGSDVFKDCFELKTIIFNGSEDQWNYINNIKDLDLNNMTVIFKK